MKTGSTGRHRREVGALQMTENGKFAARKVNDRPGNHEGRDTAGTAFDQRPIVAAEHVKAPDAGADDAAGAVRFFFIFFGKSEVGVIERLHAGGTGVGDEAVKTPGFLCREPITRFKPLHFARNLRAELRGIKVRNFFNAALTGKNGFPSRSHIEPQGANGTEAGDNDATHSGLFPFSLIGFNRYRAQKRA